MNRENEENQEMQRGIKKPQSLIIRACGVLRLVDRQGLEPWTP